MKKTLFIVAFVTALILAACVGSSGENSPLTIPPVPTEYAGKTNPLGADAAIAGKEIFETNCVACHGQTGMGDGPAGDSLDPHPANLHEVNRLASEDFIYWVVKEGVPGTSMVAWKDILTNEQIWQVVAYVRTLK